jgi:hypothetical protein
LDLGREVGYRSQHPWRTYLFAYFLVKLNISTQWNHLLMKAGNGLCNDLPALVQAFGTAHLAEHYQKPTNWNLGCLLGLGGGPWLSRLQILILKCHPNPYVPRSHGCGRRGRRYAQDGSHMACMSLLPQVWHWRNLGCLWQAPSVKQLRGSNHGVLLLLGGIGVN